MNKRVSRVKVAPGEGDWVYRATSNEVHRRTDTVRHATEAEVQRKAKRGAR